MLGASVSNSATSVPKHCGTHNTTYYTEIHMTIVQLVEAYHKFKLQIAIGLPVKSVIAIEIYIIEILS